MDNLSSIEQDFSEIETMARQLHYTVYRRETTESAMLFCTLAPGSPMSIQFTLIKNDSQILMNGNVRATGLAGDKTDIHDVLSTLWSFYLRAHFGISTKMISIILDDILPHEIYARTLYFTQPFPTTSFSQLEQIKLILETTILVGIDIQLFMMQVVNDPDDWGECQEPISDIEQQQVLNALSLLRTQRGLLSAYRRRNPDWDYYLVAEQGISILKVSTPIQYDPQKTRANLKSLAGLNDIIIFPESQATRNSIQKKRLALTRKLVREITGYRDKETLIVPVDSDLIAICHDYLIRIPSSTGYSFYLKERDRIIQRRSREAVIINDTLRFDWAVKIDDDEFESLVAELLLKEPGIIRVRKVSAGREQDRGRDLMAEWNLPSSAKDEPYKRHRIVVQCKAYSNSVNKSSVQDIRDTIDRHKADGYCLVVSSSLTTSLFDYLDDLRSRKQFFIDWWTRLEIEDRIRRNPDLLVRFPKVVKPHKS